MKRKFSTKLFSAFLAVIMVLTSVPVTALASFNDEDAAKAAVVKQATDEMDKFETMLETSGTSYSNVTPAYNAYVALQKALDAYQYGTSSSSVVTSAVSALTNAMSGMTAFDASAVKGTAVPTFANSSASDMSGYAGRGYNNVLYAPQATVQSDADAPGGVRHEIIYAPNAVLLYNNGADMILPVLAGIYRSADKEGYDARNKNRMLRSAYPYAGTDFNDDPNWGFDSAWNSGNGNDMNWNWNFWSGESDNSGSHLAYNYATGFKGKNQGAYTTATVPTGGVKRSGFINYSYSHDGNLKHLYAANAIKFKNTAVNDFNHEYTLSWYTTSGADNDNDAAQGTASTAIRVINYTTLTNAITRKAGEIKGNPVDDYSEGGLAKYFEVMDRAKAWDPNTYFAGGTDGYSNCVTDLKALVQTDINGLNISSLPKNSDGYKALRAAMDNRGADYNKGVNTIYKNFDGFADLYTQAMTLMNEVNANGGGYTRSADAQSLADQINAYVLEKNEDVKKVVADELVALIDAYNNYDKELFVTTDNVQTVIDNAIAIVWQNDTYKKEAALLDDDADGANQAIVDEQVALVRAAIEGLRINPAAVTLTDEGYHSLNEVCDLIADPNNIKGHPSGDYANYANLQSLINAVTSDGGYRYQLANTPLTDYDAQVAEYKTKIAEIIAAYEGLVLSFMAIDDGTVAKTVNQLSTSVESKLTANIDRSGYLSFSLNGPGGVVLKKTHDAATIKFGEATIGHGTTVNGDKYNNFLDSFTLNADSLSTAIEFAGSGNDTLPTLTAEQKATYAASLRLSEGFSISNLKVSGTNQYYNSGYFAYSESGADVRINDVNSNEYDSILGTTTGSNRQGGIYVKSTTTDNFGTIYLTGDLNIDVPATSAIADNTVYLSKDELLAKYPEARVISDPTTKNVSHYYGGLMAWNANGSSSLFQYSGFTFLKSSEAYNTGVTVLDLSNYFDFVSLCDLLAAKDSDRYTAESWSAFINALSNAKMYEYAGKDASTIRLNLNDKYLQLYNALYALTEKSYTVTFITKDANGADVTTVIKLGYQDTVANHAAEFEAIDLDATYVDGNMTYSFSHFTPEFDETLIVAEDATYTAVYTGTVNYVNFDAYNQTKAALLDLADYTYTVADLNKIAADVATYTYFDMPEAEKATLLATDEIVAAVNAETAAMQALIDSLTPASVSADYKDVAYAAEQLRAQAVVQGKADPDQYGSLPEYQVYESVAITDAVSVIGWKYTDEAAIENAITEFLNNLQLNTYDIYLNGEVVKADVPYGTAVIVDSNKNVSLDVDDTDVNDPNCANVNWWYSFDAPSRNGAGATDPKYYVTAPSVGFKVQGDTYLTTESAEKTETAYVVKVVSTTGNIIDVAVTTGTYTLPAAPSYAFYSFDKYTVNGTEVSGNVEINKDTTIVANYIADAKDTYKIDYFYSYTDVINYNIYWEEPVETFIGTKYASYNDLVSLEGAQDTYCWAIITSYADDAAGEYYNYLNVIYYGKDYNFYAYQTYDFIDGIAAEYQALVPLTLSEYEKLVMDQTKIVSLEGGQYEAQFDEKVKQDSTQYSVLESIDGTPILAEIEYDSKLDPYKVVPAVTPFATAYEEQISVKNASGSTEKFTLIGTFATPQNYKVVENGFLFATNTTINPATMTVENAGNGFFRYKAPKYTVGNQFTSNIIYPGGALDFTYVAYTIVKSTSGELITCYSNPVQVNGKTF